MAVMEFLKKNILNTTTMIKVDSATSLTKYLFDRNVGMPYETSGYNSDTSTIISIEFGSTTPVSHILLQNHNLKQFRLFYDSLTANSISIFTTNSDTSNYLAFSTIQAASIQLQMDNTIAGAVEKSVGEFVLSERKLAFDVNPTQSLFKPIIMRKQIVHNMPDGGTVVYNIKDKYQAKIGLRYITTAFYNSLFDVYEDAEVMRFVPFPTSTGWDGKGYEVVWPGKFDFTFADNAKKTYSGNILIKEIPST